MEKADYAALGSLFVSTLVGAAMAWAGSQGGDHFSGLPVFALVVGLIFVVQWMAFIPAYLTQSERFFDLVGSLTYVSAMALAIVLGPGVDGRSIMLLVLATIWAARLGSFLFQRVHRVGKDGRFDEMKPSFLRFLNTWTLQGLWVSLTLATALAAITTPVRRDLGWFAWIGFAVWALGFATEAAADDQKRRFRADPVNEGRFIQTGLWARSRHPNYLGEIVLWTGVAIISLPVLRGWQWTTLISPAFVALLLTRISGVPMLEKRADKRWGGQADYEAYKARTPVLVPRVFDKK